jgi:hypothetical protein
MLASEKWTDLDAPLVLDAIKVGALGKEGKPQRRVVLSPRFDPDVGSMWNQSLD